MWCNAREVKILERADGKAKIYILARDDGFYQYEGYAEFEEDGEVYWGPAQLSGLYDTAEQAERDAFHEVPWLRQISRLT